MATLAEHTAARNDEYLKARLTAAAEQAGIDGASWWVEQNLGKLVSIDLDPSEAASSLSDVFAYAVAQKGLPPGADPAFVTDIQLRSAIEAVKVSNIPTPLPVAYPPVQQVPASEPTPETTNPEESA